MTINSFNDIMNLVEELRAEVKEDIKREEEMYGATVKSSVTKKFLAENGKELYPGWVMRDAAVCKDGFTVSIQASAQHYCCPRACLKDGDYETVELGFPNSPDDLITEYAEDDDKLTGTVYPNVPIEVVDRLIEKHGGLAE